MLSGLLFAVQRPRGCEKAERPLTSTTNTSGLQEVQFHGTRQSAVIPLQGSKLGAVNSQPTDLADAFQPRIPLLHYRNGIQRHGCAATDLCRFRLIADGSKITSNDARTSMPNQPGTAAATATAAASTVVAFSPGDDRELRLDHRRALPGGPGTVKGFRGPRRCSSAEDELGGAQPIGAGRPTD
jgi:hypothetical protein